MDTKQTIERKQELKETQLEIEFLKRRIAAYEQLKDISTAYLKEALKHLKELSKV